MVFTPSRTAQIQVHNREERRAGSPDDQGEHRHEDIGRINETKTMCSITKSVGFRIPPARLQDIHKVGPPTGIPPTDSRSCDQSGTNIQHPVGKLQTQETSLEQNHSRTSSMRRFSEYSGDVPHCLNQRDDILPGGRDEEQKCCMRTVIQRARDHGITFNREKCQFGREKIEFFGHIFTKDGLKPSPDKVKAIKQCGVPESKEVVRSFLGMAGYLVSFISNYAAIAAPLYRITRKETKIRWEKHLGRYKTPSQMPRPWHTSIPASRSSCELQ